MQSMSAGNIPLKLPQAITLEDATDLIRKHQDNPLNFLFPMRIHDDFHRLGMFGIISVEGASYLKNKFPNARFLDPLAGRGWIAKALREQGCNVIAGDIEPYLDEPLTDVIQSDGADLVKQYKDEADVLILSWPHRFDDVDFNCAKAWGCEKPIICYGEIGRSSFSNEFIEIVRLIEDCDDFPDMHAQTLRRTKLVICQLNPEHT